MGTVSGHAKTQGEGTFHPLRWIAARLRARPDSEHELTINRLALSGLVFGYLIVARAFGSADAAQMLSEHGIFFGLYYAISVLLFGHVLYQPQSCPARRVLGIFFDFGMFSYGMHVGDEAMAPFFPIYLWVILGNGFRFGVPYLAAAACVGFAGFAVVILTTDVWIEHRSLGIGLLSSLVFIPLYVSTLIRKLSAAKRQAEEANRAKSLFLAGVSHELRTPLNAVIGLSDLLMASRMDAEQKDMTRTIGASGRALLAFINSILDFARIEAGQMPKNSIDFDLYALISEIRKMLAVQAAAKNLTLAIHITPRVPRQLRGPKSHLTEILMNLAANAVKFTERGYVVIAVDAVTDTGSRLRLLFEVTDTGIGIAPKAQGRIFDRFVQADETIIDRFGGTGLGLALVKQLVELHGGGLGVESAPGAGSTFWCELQFERNGAAAPTWSPRGLPVILQSQDDALRGVLQAIGASVSVAASPAEAASIVAQVGTNGRSPILVVDGRSAGEEVDTSVPAVLVTHENAPGMLVGSARSRFVTSLTNPVNAAGLTTALEIAAGCELSDASEEERAAIPASRRKLTILLAEDNRTNQKVIAKILDRAGHETRVVENGEQAMDALSEQAFDLVLMDVNMPVMNGIETTKLYRFASLGQPRIPIVALTADATPEMEARCSEAGMDACLTKPIEPVRLVAMIDQLMAAQAGGNTTPVLGDGVVEITDHPKFPAGAPALKLEVLDDLRALGGDAFISDLAVQFVRDAALLHKALEQAARDRDVQAFRDNAHALRSGAANIGAHRVHQMCLSWRRIDGQELERRGEAHTGKLAAELARVQAALDRYLGGSMETAATPDPTMPSAAAR